MVILVSETRAQDPIFSLNSGNLSYINPSYCAVYDGLSSKASHRMQWPNVPGGFNYSIYSLDHSLLQGKENYPSLAYGITILNDHEGKYGYNVLTYAGRIGSRVKILPAWLLSTGIQYSRSDLNLQWNDLVFSDQLNEMHGIIYSTSFAKPDNYAIRNISNISFGVISNLRLSKQSQLFTDILVGYALSTPIDHSRYFFDTRVHTNQKQVGFISLTNELPSLTQSITGIYSDHGPFHSAYFSYDVFLNSLKIGIGCRLYENFDAIVFKTGLFSNEKTIPRQRKIHGRKKPNWKIIYEIDYSYDLTISKLKTSTLGSHEFSLCMHLAENFRRCKNLTCDPNDYIDVRLYQNQKKSNVKTKRAKRSRR